MVLLVIIMLFQTQRPIGGIWRTQKHNEICVGTTTDRGRMPHPIQYLHWMIGGFVKECCSTDPAKKACPGPSRFYHSATWAAVDHTDQRSVCPGISRSSSGDRWSARGVVVCTSNRSFWPKISARPVSVLVERCNFRGHRLWDRKRQSNREWIKGKKIKCQHAGYEVFNIITGSAITYRVVVHTTSPCFDNTEEHLFTLFVVWIVCHVTKFLVFDTLHCQMGIEIIISRVVHTKLQWLMLILIVGHTNSSLQFYSENDRPPQAVWDRTSASVYSQVSCS